MTSIKYSKEDKLDSDKRIIEINGVKLEVDLRMAKVVEQYKVGDGVKVLRKRYSDQYEVLPAAIVGICEFAALPTIELVAVNHSGDVEFIVFDAKSEGIEIAPMNKYELALDRQAIESQLLRNVEKAQGAVREAETKLLAFRTEIVKAFTMSEA